MQLRPAYAVVDIREGSNIDHYQFTLDNQDAIDYASKHLSQMRSEGWRIVHVFSFTHYLMEVSG